MDSAHSKQYPDRQEIGKRYYLSHLSEDPDSKNLLTPQEKEAILAVENMLCMSKNLNTEKTPQLLSALSMFQIEEDVHGLYHAVHHKVLTFEIFLEFCNTEEGKIALQELGYHGEYSHNRIQQFLASLGDTSPLAVIQQLSAQSRAYALSSMVEQFQKSDFSTAEQVKNPSRMVIVLNPDELVKQLDEYSKLKKYLDRFSDHCTGDSRIFKALLAISSLYQERLNELIYELYPSVVAFIEQECISEKPKHRDLISRLRTILTDNRFAKLEYIAYSRSKHIDGLHSYKDKGDILFEKLDKYINGVAVKHDDEYEVISPELKRLESEEDHGIDVSNETNIIDASQFKSWAERVLQEYHLLSTVEHYSPERKGRAEDDKWQVILDPVHESLSVDPLQGILKIPKNFQRPLYSVEPCGALAVLDHEIAHILQYENRQKIQMSLVREIGMSQSSIFAEAGASSWEDEAQKKLIKKEPTNNLHYLRAIEKKLHAGTLRECALAYFKSFTTVNPGIDKPTVMRIAIDRSMRLFRNGGVYHDSSGHLTNSEPLVYLEQVLLVRELKKYHLKHLILLSGVNIQGLYQMHRYGLFEKTQFHIPKMRPSEFILDTVSV